MTAIDPAAVEKVKPVVVESPFKGDREKNKRYLERCLRDCVMRGESPYASHKMLTDCLDDDDPAERRLGITAGLVWKRDAKMTVFYVDLGWSEGMELARDFCHENNRPYEIRMLPVSDLFWAHSTSAREWLWRTREHWLEMAGNSALAQPSPAQVQSMLRRFDWALDQPESRTAEAARELGWNPKARDNG